MSGTDDPTEPPRKAARRRLRAVPSADESAAPPLPLRAVTPHESSRPHRDPDRDRSAGGAGGAPHVSGAGAGGAPHVRGASASGRVAVPPADAGASGAAPPTDGGASVRDRAAPRDGALRGAAGDAARRLRAAPLRLVPRIPFDPDDIPPGAA